MSPSRNRRGVQYIMEALRERLKAERTGIIHIIDDQSNIASVKSPDHPGEMFLRFLWVDDHCEWCEYISTGRQPWWTDPNTIQGQTQLVEMIEHVMRVEKWLRTADNSGLKEKWRHLEDELQLVKYDWGI